MNPPQPSPPARRTFISYSSHDRPVAERLCAALEAAGTPCWIAPRDIVPSAEWAEQIIRGINQASAMLLVFSSRSNASPQVCREVERAVHKQVPVIPFRIEDVVPTRSLEYFLSAQHWLDAGQQPVEQWGPYLTRLIDGFSSARDEAVARSPQEDSGFHPSAFSEWAPSALTQWPPADQASQSAAASPAEPAAAFDAAPLVAVLADYLGPVANVMVHRYAKRFPDADGLVDALAGELDAPAERAAFLRRARAALRPS